MRISLCRIRLIESARCLLNVQLEFNEQKIDYEIHEIVHED
jgi:hypothetical protein